MDLDAWFDHARRQATARVDPALEPLLEMLRRATLGLRAADWSQGRDDGHAAPDAATPAAGTAGGSLRPSPPAAPATTIADLAAALRRREVSASALVEGCLATIAERDGTLNAFVLVRGDDARAEADAADRALARGEDRGPLHGIPVSLKDVIDLAGTPTTAATAARIAPRAAVDAAVTARLRAAGAVVVGKCNLHELAFGTTGEASAFGPTRNPHDPRRVAGGSSGGSAISVATGMALASVGTDTGGSIRIPASACGAVGLKPAYGEVSTDGVFPLAPSLDHVGPIARSVPDAELVYRALREPAGRGADAAGPPAPVPARPRLGVPRRYFLDLLEPCVEESFRSAVERLADAGCHIADAEIPHAADAGPVYLHTQLPEASACHRALLERHGDSLSEEVRLRLQLGRYVLAEDYVRAQHGRAVLTREVDAALERADALLLPVLPIVPPRLGAVRVAVGEATVDVRPLTLRLTQLFDLTGHPAVTVPCGLAGGLPAGLQLVGRRDGTDALLALAAAYEDVIRG
ncbi:MAG: amidase [Acidobacteria bacterium]|nr:amidase [Acidobacteriota bacterium]